MLGFLALIAGLILVGIINLVARRELKKFKVEAASETGEDVALLPDPQQEVDPKTRSS